MINPSKIKRTLFNIIADMDRHAYLFSKRPGIDFSRHSKLPFGKMLSFQSQVTRIRSPCNGRF